jgi:hypothetical protein
MEFMKKEKKMRLGAGALAVKAESAGRNAQFHLYSAVAARFQGFEGWEMGRMASRPTVVYDLSGLPLFYDFPVRRGRSYLGFIRTAANKALGDPVVSTNVMSPGWDMNTAKSELRKLVRKKYPKETLRGIRLVCYSYPKLALSANLVSRGRKARTILMDVGDFTEIKAEPGRAKEELGQVAYSLLDEVPDERAKAGPKVWDKTTEEVEKLFRKENQLEPKRMYKVAAKKRLEVIDKAVPKFVVKPLPWFFQKVLDFCCHSGGCKDHECFCLHPQENNVHCARASAQMMLCFWRYCYSQHEIAVAFDAPDNQGTSPNKIVPGLEELTHYCFDSTRVAIASWNSCKNEINARRPFMSCIWGHARACAGVKWWNIWPISIPQPRYLYIFDPWPPNVGAIYWENFNTTNYSTSYGMYTLVRKTTNHA